jgi:hypothetical protein
VNHTIFHFGMGSYPLPHEEKAAGVVGGGGEGVVVAMA